MLLSIVFISGCLISLYYNYINYQQLIVAKVISAEACSAGNLVMLGVGSTIQNRMLAQNKSAYQIVTAKNQYYGYTNINRDKIFQDKQCRNTALFIAKNIQDLPDVTQGAVFFRFKNETKQTWHKTLTVIINNCEFYK